MNGNISSGPNIGHSSRLPYDDCAYPDKLDESVSPGGYRLNKNQSYNCDGCLSTLGPYGKNGVSTLVGHVVAPSQQLVDLESIFTNRNVKQSKCRSGRVNHVDLNKFHLQHESFCNNYLDPIHTRFTYPAVNYKGAPINRFYNLLHDPQANIFEDHAVNTSLEMKDNFIPYIDLPMKNDNFPNTIKGKNTQCLFECDDNKICGFRGKCKR